jgi:uncharacterized membrane protein
MRSKGWLVDLRQWAELPSIIWLCFVSTVVYGTARLLLDSAVGVVLSMMCVLLASTITSGVALYR